MSQSLDMLFGKPVEYAHNVRIKIPTVEEVANDANFNTYVSLFTKRTRELFGMSREVDAIEAKYPTILSMTQDEQMDFVLGKMFGSEHRGSALIMEALHYWTGLELSGENGFQLLSNGKIIHIGTEWIIDEAEWERFSDTVKTIISFNETRDFTPPKPMNSDAKFNAWKGLLNGRLNKLKKSGGDMSDKILILSISSGAYIPIEDIRKMSIYVFNRLLESLSKKEAYEMNMRMLISGNFDSEKIDRGHWTTKIMKNNKGIIPKEKVKK